MQSGQGGFDLQVVDLDPSASKVEHEAAIVAYLKGLDPELGEILAPYLAFDHLDDCSDVDRRRLRSEITGKVRQLLDAEETGGTYE